MACWEIHHLSLIFPTINLHLVRFPQKKYLQVISSIFARAPGVVNVCPAAKFPKVGHQGLISPQGLAKNNIELGWTLKWNLPIHFYFDVTYIYNTYFETNNYRTSDIIVENGSQCRMKEFCAVAFEDFGAKGHKKYPWVLLVFQRSGRICGDLARSATRCLNIGQKIHGLSLVHDLSSIEILATPWIPLGSSIRFIHNLFMIYMYTLGIYTYIHIYIYIHIHIHIYIYIYTYHHKSWINHEYTPHRHTLGFASLSTPPRARCPAVAAPPPSPGPGARSSPPHPAGWLWYFFQDICRDIQNFVIPEVFWFIKDLFQDQQQD